LATAAEWRSGSYRLPQLPTEWFVFAAATVSLDDLGNLQL
jgi:hypothetical protein